MPTRTLLLLVLLGDVAATRLLLGGGFGAGGLASAPKLGSGLVSTAKNMLGQLRGRRPVTDNAQRVCVGDQIPDVDVELSSAQSI